MVKGTKAKRSDKMTRQGVQILIPMRLDQTQMSGLLGGLGSMSGAQASGLRWVLCCAARLNQRTIGQGGGAESQRRDNGTTGGVRLAMACAGMLHEPEGCLCFLFGASVTVSFTGVD